MPNISGETFGAVEDVADSVGRTLIKDWKRTTMRVNILGVRRYESSQSTKELLMNFDIDKTSSVDRRLNCLRLLGGDRFEKKIGTRSTSRITSIRRHHRTRRMIHPDPWNTPRGISKC
jgi:hypothetical protein